MELRTVDPRSLKINLDNPRRTGAGEHPDAQMVANIKAVGILEPPVVREKGTKLERDGRENSGRSVSGFSA